MPRQTESSDARDRERGRSARARARARCTQPRCCADQQTGGGACAASCESRDSRASSARAWALAVEFV